jgi:Flp pilus assembly protein TadD
LELNPKQANAHNNLGVMLGRMGRTDEAIAHYRKALDIDPLETDHLENLVSALVKAGRWDDATAALRNALALAKSTGDEARTQTITQALAEVREAIRSLAGGAGAQVR